MTQDLHLTPRPDQMSDEAACDSKAVLRLTMLCHPTLHHAWLAALCHVMLCCVVLWCAVQIPQGYPAGPGERAPGRQAVDAV